MAPADPAPDAVGELTVWLVYNARAGHLDEEQLRLPQGACVRDALARSTTAGRHSELGASGAAGVALRIGIWGKLRGLDEPLREQDRIEIYRPLQVDPKEARRLRHRQHRERVKG